MSYLVFLCWRCGEPRYARSHVKAAKCFRCGYVNRLDEPGNVKVVANKIPLKDAIYIVQYLKASRYGLKRARGETSMPLRR